jgi:hypothetical protein
MHQARVSSREHHQGVKEGEANRNVVQQLMFNRILSHLRTLWVDGVTVTSFDAETGTVACTHAGVHVVVTVSLSAT